MQERVEGFGKADGGWEVSAQGEDGGLEKNGYEGKGREVSGLGHVSYTLESPQERGAGCGEAWMS